MAAFRAWGLGGSRLLCLALALVLAGCAGLTERAAGWYITRKLDGYLDLTSEQKRAARSRVDETLEVLRRGELPAWVSLLREVRHGVGVGLEEPDIARLQRRYDARLDAAVAILSPQLSAILADLSSAQLNHFARRMREDVDEQYEERGLPESERRAAVEERSLKALEGLVGSLSDAQEDAVRDILRSLPDERTAQYRVAHEQITKFRAFMARTPSREKIDAELRSMWERRYERLGPGRDKATRRAEQRRALLAVYRLLTEKQRAHVEEELTDRIRMLKRFLITG